MPQALHRLRRRQSEISKPLTDAILTGPVFVADFKRTSTRVERAPRVATTPTASATRRASDRRSSSAAERSLGSVIKLLTPDAPITPRVQPLAARPSRSTSRSWCSSSSATRPEWGDDWREHFSVDIINGSPATSSNATTAAGHAPTCASGSSRTAPGGPSGCGRTSIPPENPGGRRHHRVVVARRRPRCGASADAPAPETALRVKFVQNCESGSSSGPTTPSIRGYDKQTEADFARPDNFFSNYEPLTPADARELMEDAIGFDQFTEPMQRPDPRSRAERRHRLLRLLGPAAAGRRQAEPRTRATSRCAPTSSTRREAYLAEMAAHGSSAACHLAARSTRPSTPCCRAAGNNPPEGRHPPARASSTRIHYLELPELFLEFICCMTGKSPSTTGAGSEGALTKGPFNALPPIIDLNNALVSFLLTGHEAFVTAAGYVGTEVAGRSRHQPPGPRESGRRMSAEERDPRFLIRTRLPRKVPGLRAPRAHGAWPAASATASTRASSTPSSARSSPPHTVFTEAMLRPEPQDLDVFADGSTISSSTQQPRRANVFRRRQHRAGLPAATRAAPHHARMASGRGKDLGDSEFRELFARENLLASDWYAARLAAKQSYDIEHYQRAAEGLERFQSGATNADTVERLHVQRELQAIYAGLARVSKPGLTSPSSSAHSDAKPSDASVPTETATVASRPARVIRPGCRTAAGAASQMCRCEPVQGAGLYTSGWRGPRARRARRPARPAPGRAPGPPPGRPPGCPRGCAGRPGGARRCRGTCRARRRGAPGVHRGRDVETTPAAGPARSAADDAASRSRSRSATTHSAAPSSGSRSPA